jgi:hypothetical protein
LKLTVNSSAFILPVDLSALINKPNAASVTEYAQVDLTKKSRPNNLNDPPGVKVNNSYLNKGIFCCVSVFLTLWVPNAC